MQHIENIIMGYGDSISATMGAKMDAIRPRSLAKPKAVYEYRGENNKAKDKYTTLNKKLIPTFASITMNGM